MADKLLKSLTFPDLDDKYIIGDKTLANSGAAADAKTTGDALATKANIDGSYADLSAGTADQLNTDVRANDKTPYIFRTTGGSTDVGDREYVNGIVGGTVAWNQLFDQSKYRADGSTGAGFTITNVDNKYLLINGSRTDTYCALTSALVIGWVAGHKYLIDCPKMPNNVTGYNVTVYGSVFGNNLYNGSKILEAQTTATGEALYFRFQPDAGQTATVTNYKFYAHIFDLTQMFGSTIADYIYSLETANAGAGVAFFKKLFDKPYYAYDSGSSKSVEGLVSHDTTGFNQWDEEWELADIDWNTGRFTPNTSGTRFSSKNFIKVIPNATYFFKSPASAEARGIIYGYANEDDNGSFVGYNQGTFVIPNGINYIKFGIQKDYYGTTYNHDICISLNWDGSRQNDYEPYIKHSYPLDSSVILRGIMKLDADNKPYYFGDRYFPNGTLERVMGIVDLGTLTWTYSTSPYEGFYCDNIGALPPSATDVVSNAICAKYVTAEYNSVFSKVADKIIAIRTNGGVRIYDSAYTDAVAFKTAMNGVYLVYELATPTTETADPYTTPQICDDFGTEEYVFSDSVFPVPVGSNTDYPINMRSKLEMAPNSPSGDGDYIVRQTSGMNSYVPLVIEDALPTMPSTEGTYKLTVTVASGSDPVLSWEAE